MTRLSFRRQRQGNRFAYAPLWCVYCVIRRVRPTNSKILDGGAVRCETNAVRSTKSAWRTCAEKEYNQSGEFARKRQVEEYCPEGKILDGLVWTPLIYFISRRVRSTAEASAQLAKSIVHLFFGDSPRDCFFCDVCLMQISDLYQDRHTPRYQSLIILEQLNFFVSHDIIIIELIFYK